MRVKSKMSMANKAIKYFIALISLVIVFAFSARAKAAEGYWQYSNPATGYQAIIIDNADYIAYVFEEKLLEEMKPITAYTNVVYITDEGNYRGTEKYSEDLCESIAHSLFGAYENVVVYDCDNEYDYIYSQGAIQKTITSSRAYSITDNIYRLSAKEEYYKAAVKAFKQINSLFEGKLIAEPMKYVCIAIISILIAFLINFSIVSKKSKLKRVANAELIEGAISWVETNPPEVVFVTESKTYSPQSSGGGGGGHGGHGGGGHGGGGHSGGGHSH